MNIQIFGTKKCFDTKKAERFFKERGIKYQYIDLKETEMSPGELKSVAQAVGGIEKLVDKENKDRELVLLLEYLVPSERFDKILDNQHILITPIVRNGKKATVGYEPEIWKTWE